MRVFTLCKTMFRLRIFNILLLLILFFTLITAFEKPQVFHYSRKYTVWRRGGRKNFKNLTNGSNVFETIPESPKHQTNFTNLYYYNVPNSDNTPMAVATRKPQTKLQPNSFTGTHAYRLIGNKKNKIGTSAEQREGSFCRRSFDGKPGYCISAHQCLHAVNKYRVHRAKIDICTYSQGVPVICCPLFEKLVEPKTLSAKKCEQYNDVVESIKFDYSRKFSGKTCVPSLPLIVGGQVTNEGEYPHMAALGWSRVGGNIRWNCGGSLISELYVLTAAHCATSSEKPPDVVRLGAVNLNEATDELQDVGIASIILHPNYKSISHYDDIALIKLVNKVKITPKVRPGCLWQLPDTDITYTVATGWGRTDFRGPRSDKLQKVELSIIDQTVCKKLYSKERRLPNGILNEQFCAGHMAGGKDTCLGDSGGPVHAELPEMKCVKFIIGVTSFGKFCAKSNAPGVYIKVFPYLQWIESIAFMEK